MRNKRQQTFLFILPLTIVFVLLLAACGPGGDTGSTPPATPTTVKGYGTDNGCPSDAVVTKQPAKVDIRVEPPASDSTIVVHKGDVIEIRLPFGKRWTGPTTSQRALQLQEPAGYALKAEQVCLWHFVANDTGTAQLTFSSQALCKPGTLCAMYIMDLLFTFKIIA